MSSTLETPHTPSHRPSRSRSSSVTESTSPDSTSSDSHSSSDPDTHLSSLSPWLQTPNTIGSKAAFGMDIDAASNPHMMDLDPEMTFDAGIHNLQDLDSFQAGSFTFDDLGLNNQPTNTKSEILMLEEIIRDGAFDPVSTTVPAFSSYPTRSPAFRELFVPPLPHPPHESQLQSQPHPVCVNPSSTQAQPQPTFPMSVESSEARDPTPIFKTEPAGVLLLSPNSRTVNDTSFTREPSISSSQSCSYEPSPPAVISSDVVYPSKDVCLDLPIFFPSIPPTGTKSRVETQIKLSFELAIPVSSSSGGIGSPRLGRTLIASSSRPSSSSSSSSNSPSESPVSGSRDVSPEGRVHQRPTHDKVGTYKFLRLPRGTATKRRSANSASIKRDNKASEVSVQDILDMTAEVVCCSSPHASVQSCPSCQSREAKRTARKVAARVRPPPSARPKSKVKGSGRKSSKKMQEQDIEGSVIDEEEDVEEPNVDGSILQFNCSELMDFSGGAVILPMRITCYCRHHKEKIGFNIVFTLRDHEGRIVGRGATPPILITDDHKSTNAASKLPHMHSLRHALTPSAPPPSAPSPSNSVDESQPASPQEHAGRAPTKRRDVDVAVKKRRPKPYDGRPVNRTVGAGPGIEGRQGVVLALHPAHARAQAAALSAVPTGVAFPNTSTDAGTSSAPRVSSLPATRSSTPSCYEAPLTSSLSSLNGFLTPQRDGTASAFGPSPAASHPPSPRTVSSSFQSTVAPPSTSLPSSSVPQANVQSLPDVHSYSQEEQAVFDPSAFSLYPSYAPDPLSLPKIHRLIPSSGPTTGGIEITVLGSNFHASISLECVFGGAVASSTHRWSDNTLVCVLPPRATPGLVSVGFKGVKDESGQDEGGACLFNYVDESDRQLMELALQVVGLKMTGKIEEARNVAMRIVGNTNTQTPTMTAGEVTQINTLSGASFMHHSFLGSLSGMDLETLIIKLLTLLDVPLEDTTTPVCLTSRAIGHQSATGQTLLHLAVLLALPALVSCLVERSVDLDARNNNGLTALHFAALTGWKEGAELLLAAGADVSVVDSMGLTASQRAKNGRFEELEALLEVPTLGDVREGESGEEGDDEAWHSGSEESDGGRSDGPSSPWSAAPPRYTPRSRLGSSTHADSSPEEFSEAEEIPETVLPQSQTTKAEDSPSAHSVPVDEKPAQVEKQDASFVERLQRTLPQGILPNVQMPGLPQLQLPGMLAAPWGVFPQIPVFPVLVPIPNLPQLPNWPAFPWPDALSGDKKATRTDCDATGEKHQQQPPLAMLWAAYDNLANNAWRTQWEKWTAQVTALQNGNDREAELPPMYTPRSDEQQPLAENQASIPPPQDAASPSTSGTVMTDESQDTSTSRTSAFKAIRRMGYGTVKVPETEIASYHYQSKKKINQKQDRMLVLFWIPILILGLAYAVYITLPMAIAGFSQATKKMLPRLPQRDRIHV